MQMKSFSYLSLLLLSASLLHTTSSSVYYVIPDEHYTTNNNTYTLQHYLNNTNKYFTSHTQLHFLPGQYYLNTDLIIQHVNNLSLIGNRTNEVINSVIKCTSPAGIVVVGSSNIVIANIVMNECGKGKRRTTKISKAFHSTSLFITNSRFVSITHFYPAQRSRNCGYGLILMNVMGNLTDINANFIVIWYDNSASNNAYYLHVSHCQLYSNEYINGITHALEIQRVNTSSDITITIKQCQFTTTLAILNLCIQCSGRSTVMISHCHFTAPYGLIDNCVDTLYYYSTGYYDSCTNIFYKMVCFNHRLHYYTHKRCGTSHVNGQVVYNFYENCKHNFTANEIHFVYCYFMEIHGNELDSTVGFGVLTTIYDKRARDSFIILIAHSVFYNNTGVSVIDACYYNSKTKTDFGFLMIQNTSIKSFSQRIQTDIHSVEVRHMRVYFEGLIVSTIPVSFTHHSTVINALNSYLQFSKYNEISQNTVYCAIEATKIYLSENSVINLTNNTFITAFNNYFHKVDDIEDCFVQYKSIRGNLDEEFQLGYSLNYTIVFNANNILKQITNTNLKHCSWDKQSAFLVIQPLIINQNFIHYANNDTQIQNVEERHICLCTSTPSCQQDEMGSFYPGQLIQTRLTLNTISEGSILVERRGNAEFACKSETRSDKQSNTFQLVKNECKNITFIATHKNGKWCELCLIATAHFYHEHKSWVEMYTITLLPCPKGFSLHPQGYCQCDPILSSHIASLTTCDIDHQTIPHPANTWISAHTINNSHSYHVSLHCPFDYCLPHSSQLNLSTPDSQCQFNRSGVLCGQCQHGLSTVFGSSQCKHCSNIYLLIIIPIGLAGIALVLLLLVLNLTVTDGKLNSFIFYVNIISINASTFFLSDRSLPYTFIALANLDLGIETCFYNGMDDYVKMWLQLVFPIYLIFIAALLIIISRYSTTIQRLTACRALPVFATLFLLSYTKVLLTVSNVLFSYTSIIHLPSNRTTLVWSVDTSVPLFGVKFTILFIACLILFLVLVLFIVVLIFTKQLSYFKVVNYFKPLLDAYQDPYKIKFYYWTGLQLLTRAILFGMSNLDRESNLMVASLLLAIIVWANGKISPFNSTVNNAMDFSFLLNLVILFIVSMYTHSTAIVNIFVSIAMLQLLCTALYNGYNLTCGTVFNGVHFKEGFIQKFVQYGKDLRKKLMKMLN